MIDPGVSMEKPNPSNGYQVSHVGLMTGCFKALTGRNLIVPKVGLVESARALYHAPFFVASHDSSTDPVLTYGNLFAQRLFEMSWSEFISTPSRFTAEEPNREERARLLSEVMTHGFIENYSGVRISARGTRFRIKQATVWNLTGSDGFRVGQAAMFDHWEGI